MLTDRRTAKIDKDALQLIFDRLYEKVLKRSEDEKHAADRHQRRAVDALRSRIKHLDPPIRSSDSWEQVRSRIEKYDEFRALETDEPRKAAFEKVVKRLKEKEEDAEKDRERRRTRREDDRDLRNGHRSEPRRGRLSTTPEIDAYEADRRKAMADREKQYRKASSLGLSPPPGSFRERDRDRDRRDDRHGRLDRSPPPRHSGGYDRERREREEERERLYRTRADPRVTRDELNYGEDSRSVTGSERRRRRGGDSDKDSSDGGRRSNKRYRRDRRGSSREKKKSKTPEPKKETEVPEPAGVHSGSEEGEIEED
jgi:pre-mRNA-processing factor 40